MFLDQDTIIFDGAVSTELYSRGFYINRLFEELNLTFPAEVKRLHLDYLEAGAEVITTNTFAITHTQLSCFDLGDKQSDILCAALKIANEAVLAHQIASGRLARIGLSIGPIGELVEPLGSVSLAEVRAEFANIAKAALESKQEFSLYLLETFSNLSELQAAIEGLRLVDNQHPILASIHCKAAQESQLAEFVGRIGGMSQVQALGLNCSEGPSQLLTALQRLKPMTKKPIVVRPNAGLPRAINGRYFYMTSPDYLGKFAQRYIAAGAVGVGGCCGTGPEHIRAIATAFSMLRAQSESQIEVRAAHSIPASIAHATTNASSRGRVGRPENIPARSDVGARLAKGQKVFSIEVLSPKGTDLAAFMRTLEQIERAGIELVNVPDGARASTRVSSLHLAARVAALDRKIRVLPHLTTRDRNLIALQSDVLGAYVNGVNDLLLVTGDPPKLGTNKDATAVYDIDSIGLTYLVNCLNHAVSPTGDEIGQGTGFGLGVASNPTAINVELEAGRWAYKHESGANFAVTQPIFDAESFWRWRERITQTYLPHVVGIWPLASLRNAEFMANEVPGVHVPKWVIEEMAKAGDDQGEALKRGVAIAQKTIAQLNDSCEGFCVSAPFGRASVAIEALAAAGIGS